MDTKDYYAILGVKKDATADEIKRAYRKLARKYHPDVNKEPDADAKFKDAGEAFDVLKDEEKRAAYDQYGQAGFAGAGAGGAYQPPPGWDEEFSFSQDDSGQDYSDFFQSMFRRAGSGPSQGFERGTRQTANARGSDHHVRVMLELEDAFNGPTRVLTLRMPDMDAQGRLVYRDKNISVKIPKGVKEGQNIRLKGQGMPGYGTGAAGDLFLEVAFAPHRVFKVDGRDLYMDLPVSPWEAALGGKVLMPTPGGKVEVNIPENARAGQKMRLKGRGIPGATPGDLYVTLVIVNPPKTTQKGRELFEKLAEEQSFNPRAKLGG